MAVFRRHETFIRISTLFQRHYGRKHSSNLWIERQLKDPYVKKAAEENWRCRSAFKLLEIDDKYKILKPGQIVLDCGCAPGSWMQVIVQRINANGSDRAISKGFVIGVDIQHVNPVDGAHILNDSDITSPNTQNKILTLLNGRKVDLVLSDMAPARSSDKDFDHVKIIELCSSVIRLSTVVMNDGGTLLCKIWSGRKQKTLEEVLNKLFSRVKIVKPMASRSESAELYLLALGFGKGQL